MSDGKNNNYKVNYSSLVGQVKQRDVDLGEVKCSARMTATYSDGEEIERDADTAVPLPALASLSVGRLLSVLLLFSSCEVKFKLCAGLGTGLFFGFLLILDALEWLYPSVYCSFRFCLNA